MSSGPAGVPWGSSGDLQQGQQQQQPALLSRDGPVVVAAAPQQAGASLVPALAQELASLTVAPSQPALGGGGGGGGGLLAAEEATQPPPPQSVGPGLDLSGLAASASSSKSLQPKLLKQINSLTTKEEILNYIQHCHHLLDSINLVTCLYRLARIYSFTQSNEHKAAWKSELVRSQSFTLLLTVVHGHLTRAQAILTKQSEVPGLNARCMCNLVWSIVKLEVVGGDDGHPLALDVAIASVPLVLVFVKECSGQGLANLLWSFVKIPTSPPQVLIAIVERMVELLEQPSSSGILDAQALSNTIWAIAHIRASPPTALDNSPEWNNAVTSFLLLMANQCITLLTSAVEGGAQMQRLRAAQAAAEGGPGGQGGDGRFSCQAIVNIVWSFSTILGSACGVQEPVRPLFLVIRQLSIARMQVMLSGSAANQPLAQGLTGSFNEQALSNLVYAYDKAGLLSGDLLQAVFDVAALRVGRTSAGTQGPLGFKPQELCTLLRACHTGLAQPWHFLHALSRVMAQYPGLTQGWSAAEVTELQQALQLLHTAVPQLQQPVAAAPIHLASLALGGASNSSASSIASYPRPRQTIFAQPQVAQGPQAVVPMSAPQVGGSAQLGLYMHQHGMARPQSATSGLSLGSGSAMSSASLQPHSMVQHVLVPGVPPMGPGSAGMPMQVAMQQHPHQLHHHHAQHSYVPAQGQHYQHQLGGGMLAAAPLQQPMAHVHGQMVQDPSQLSMLQQVWVVDAAGNLQATTLLVPVQDTLHQLSLGSGGAVHSVHSGLGGAPGSGADVQPQQ